MRRLLGSALGLVALGAVALLGLCMLAAQRLGGPWSVDDEIRRRKAELDRKRAAARRG